MNHALNRRVGRPLVCSAAALVLLAGSSIARAGDVPAILQWFETSWTNIENRAPDVFMNGYQGMWVPNPSFCSFASAGFDPFDRFNLGTPENPTAFGTEAYFRAFVSEMHRAGVNVYPETIMNHNGARTNDANFIADGGWPGIYLPGNGPSNNPPGLPYVSGSAPWINCGDYNTRASGNYFWGDFHNGNTQSQDPNSSGYCLWLGDLVGLVDIAQESDYRLIRQPTGANAQNIPPGRVRNLPDPLNSRFYPDTALTPRTFTNPSVPGFSNARTITRYPFNTGNPFAGDPVVENVSEYLSRWNQWMIEVIGVDGFRIDAAKHVKHDFWNEYFDSSINLTWTTPAGTKRTPFTFGESVTSNSDILFYTRKTQVFSGPTLVFEANRDALDLNEAGSLRDLLNQAGVGSWNNPINASVDLADDGFNNGTRGVHHVYSHDNGSVGNGGAPPTFPTTRSAGMAQNAYVLLRSGVPVVYYYGREMISRYATQTGPNAFSTSTGRFWPREGNPNAMGNPTFIPGASIGVGTFNNDSTWMTTLVQIRNAYARGFFNVINSTDPVNGSTDDVLVFERTNNIAGNLVVGLNDRYDNGYDVRNVQVNFAPGTRLRELTGNAADPVVDPTGEIPDVMVVDSNRRLVDASNNTRQFLRVPRNKNTSGVEHGRGYVAYGLAAPSGTLSFVVPGTTTPAAASTIAADAYSGAQPPPFWRLRQTPLPVITSNTFELRLDTVKTDPLDNNFDNQAYFRINAGYFDYNRDGTSGRSESNAIDGGYENFLTQFSPISNTEDGNGNVIVPGTNSTGVYRQLIQTSDLVEGNNYVSVICYRRRNDGGQPVFREFRGVVYVDRLPPQVTLINQPGDITSSSFTFQVVAGDNTTSQVYIIPNVPDGVDPRTQAATYLIPANLATRYDRYEWRRTLSSIPTGQLSISVVAFEPSGNSTFFRTTGFNNVLGNGDVNADTFVTIDDLYSSWALGTYNPRADMDRNGSLSTTDRRLLELNLRTSETVNMRSTQR
jgi:glycosidase